MRFNNYISYSTILNFTYVSTSANIQAVPASIYSVISDGTGIKRLTNWNVSGLGLFDFKMNITNVGFSILYTVEGLLYFQ